MRKRSDHAHQRHLLRLGFMLTLGVLLACFIPPATPLTSHTASAAQTLPAPQNVTVVEQDDQAALVSWDWNAASKCTSPDGVAGYRVQWGLAGSTTTTTVETADCEVQLQPLVNGQTYQAVVTPVDSYGNLGTPSAPVSFTGDATRVNALRRQMTGFFDDFNLPGGALDELKWNTAYGMCNDPYRSGNVINAQFHAHIMVEDQGCDHGQTAARPRALFDFTNRTGTIAWDMDGVGSLSEWYLDLTPQVNDVSAHVFSVNGLSYPANTLRLAQFGNGFRLEYYDAVGNLQTLVTNDWQLGTNGHDTIPNVRRHWVMTVSRTHVTVTVNGDLIIDSPVNLPFEKASVLTSVFSYNSVKVGLAAMLLHWDNFGFDGPAPAVVTHNYKDANYDGGNDGLQLAAWNGTGTATTTVTIPDSVQGATAERLFFSQTMFGSAVTFNRQPGDSVTVNGTTFPIPVPEGTLGNSPWSTEVDLPVGTLHSGANTITFSAGELGVMNVHTELDFPVGSAPSFTQPGLPYNPMVMLPDIGPGITVDTINGQPTDYHGPIANGADDKVWPVTGTVTFGLSGDSNAAVYATGKYTGIARVDILVDGKVVLSRDTTGNGKVPGVPTYSDTYTLDTRTLSNGPHDFLFRAYSPKGTMSHADYFDNGTAGAPQDWPVHLDVQNTGGIASTSPTASIPTDTPVAATATGTPPATNTPVAATATGTPIPTNTSVAATATSTPPATKTPVVPAATSTPTTTVSRLGLTTIGTTQDVSDAGFMDGSRIMVGNQAETVSAISAYIGAVDAAPHNHFSVAIYTDNQGVPGSLVAQSTIGTLKGQAWNTLPVTATLQANTAYWLQYNTDGTGSGSNNMYYNAASAPLSAYSGPQTFGGWPKSYGTATTGAWQFSLYATVHP